MIGKLSKRFRGIVTTVVIAAFVAALASVLWPERARAAPQPPTQAALKQLNRFIQHRLSKAHLLLQLVGAYGLDADEILLSPGSSADNYLVLFSLGVMYLVGEGVALDPAEAVKWFRNSAAKGSQDAQFYLGMMHVKGEGVRQDFTEAAKWFKKAVELGGYPDAQYALDVLQGKVPGKPPPWKWRLKP